MTLGLRAASCFWALLGGVAGASDAPTPAEVEARIVDGEWAAAARIAGTELAAAPGADAWRSVLAAALFRGGRLREAQELFDSWPEGGAGPSARARIVRGRLLAARGRFSEALLEAEAALASAPEDPWVWFWSGELAPDSRTAIERLTRYLQIAPDSEADRIEAARGSLRTLRTLGDRPVWIPTARPASLELPLRPLWDEGGPVKGYAVEVRLGDRNKRVPLLLDTGSGGLFVLPRVARKHGLVELSKETLFGGGGKGRHRLRRGTFSRLALDSLEYADVLATTTPGELDPYGRVRGLVGLRPFGGYRITLDLPGRRLRLSPPQEGFQGEPYWSLSGQWLVEAELNGEPGLFLLDTGATTTLVDLSLAERLPESELGQPAGVRGFGGTMAGARRLDGVRVAWQGLESRGALRAVDYAARSRLGEVEIAGFLGLDLLGDAVLVIDTEARRVRVRRGPADEAPPGPRDAPPAPPAEDPR